MLNTMNTHTSVIITLYESENEIEKIKLKILLITSLITDVHNSIKMILRQSR